jgi:hypothetical protein
MIEKGSLTHNRCYPTTGPQRRDTYESTVKKELPMLKYSQVEITALFPFPT